MRWRAEDLDSSVQVQVHYKKGGDSSLCFLLMEVPWALERASGGNQHPQITRAGFSVHQQIPDNQLKTLGFITEGFPEVAAAAKSLQSPSYTVGENVDWCSHYEEPCEGSLRN